jgi:hypothetical protein
MQNSLIIYFCYFLTIYLVLKYYKYNIFIRSLIILFIIIIINLLIIKNKENFTYNSYIQKQCIGGKRRTDRCKCISNDNCNKKNRHTNFCKEIKKEFTNYHDNGSFDYHLEYSSLCDKKRQQGHYCETDRWCLDKYKCKSNKCHPK